MAGIGPAPKAPEERRNRTPPKRGEWIDLPPLEDPILPELPKRAEGTGSWSARTKAMWAGWRRDPATTQYGPGTLVLAVQLAYLFEDYVRGQEKFSEVRLVMDGLGLTEMGKRDLRWRVVVPEESPPTRKVRPSTSERRARLTVVA